MNPLELLACLGCQRIHDNLTFEARCPRCHSGYFKGVAPTKWIIFKWFITQPIHATSILIQYFREKYNESRS